MLGEVLEVIRHVLTGGGGEVEVVDLIDFTDRGGHDYAVELRRCAAYMFATMVVFGCSAWSHIDGLTGYRRGLAIAALVLSAARNCQRAHKPPPWVFTFTDSTRYADGRRGLRMSLREHFRERAADYNNVVLSNGLRSKVHCGDGFEIPRTTPDLVFPSQFVPNAVALRVEAEISATNRGDVAVRIELVMGDRAKATAHRSAILCKVSDRHRAGCGCGEDDCRGGDDAGGDEGSKTGTFHGAISLGVVATPGGPLGRRGRSFRRVRERLDSVGGENALTKAHCNFELDVPVVALVRSYGDPGLGPESKHSK